jgi:hypothetical protein
MRVTIRKRTASRGRRLEAEKPDTLSRRNPSDLLDVSDERPSVFYDPLSAATRRLMSGISQYGHPSQRHIERNN